MSDSGEKTERPTWKRLRDARRKGNVAKSRDLISALTWLAIFAVFGITAQQAGKQIADVFRQGLLRAGHLTQDLTPGLAIELLAHDFGAIALILLPLFIVVIVVAVLTSYFQIGPLLAAEGVTPNLQKLDPIQNFKQRLLAPRPYIEIGNSILKIFIAAVIIATLIWSVRIDLVRLESQSALSTIGFIYQVILTIGLRVGLALCFLAAVDLLVQKYLHLKDLKMTKQEVKDDFKEMMGNPIYKQRRRRMHTEILNAPASAVRHADVLVVNPTHLAVALRYERTAMAAPTVVAKGADLIANRLRELAGESRVPIAHNVLLARSLYELEIDEEVPLDLYEAVAEVLLWAYELNRKGN